MLLSPRGKLLSRMYNYEPAPNFSSLSQSELNLVFLLTHLVGKKASFKGFDSVNALVRSLFPSGAETIKDLFARGYLTASDSLEDALLNLTVPELKTRLAEKHLSVHGNKPDLMARYIASLSQSESEQVRNEQAVWLPTPLGYAYIRALYDVRKDMEITAVSAFLNKDFFAAVSAIYHYEERMPGSIGMDYTRIFPVAEGLAEQYADKKMTYESAVGCFQYVSGGKGLFIKSKAPSYSGLASQIQLNSYKIIETRRYRYLTALDERTCDACGVLDLKLFEVDKAEVGVNYPPMHPNCRCTTVPVVEGRESGGKYRRGRGADGKGVLLPKSMTYPEWKAWQAAGCPEDSFGWLEAYRKPLNALPEGDTRSSFSQ